MKTSCIGHIMPIILIKRNLKKSKYKYTYRRVCEARLVGASEEISQHSAGADGESSGNGVVGSPGNNQYPADTDAAHGLQLRYLRVEGHLPEGVPRPIQ